MNSQRTGKLVGWLGLGLLTFIILAPVSTERLSYRQSCFLDFMHVPFATLFSAIVFHLICGPRGQRFPPWPVAAMLVGVFLLSEWMQPYFERSFSWLDLVYDALGVMGGWILFAAHRERVKSILWGLAIVLLLAVIPFEIQMLRLYRVESRFPEVASFALPEEKPHWGLVNCEFEKTVQDHGRSWRLTVLEPGYAAFFMEHPIQDWQGFTHLELEFSVTEPVEVTLRIDDRAQTKNYFDRFQAEFEAQAGVNQYCLALEGLTISSGSRAVDWSTIHQAGLILSGVKGGENISLKTLVLRRGECY